MENAFLRYEGKRVAALALGLTLLLGCGGKAGSGKKEGRNTATTINGAGATFPYPVYARWADEYYKTSGVKMNYQSIGSGGGIRQIKAGTVDFGASDAPLKQSELESAGLFQFPMVIGGVVPVVNLEGISSGELRLTGEVLAKIFAGKITKWNDPEITALNPDLSLPAMNITVVHRADGSGTTWIFTNYLDKVSPLWHESVGAGKAVSWPAGIGGKGNEGVAAYVSRVKGGIGYVEYAYAVQNRMTSVLLRNRAGEFVAPTNESFRAAAANADWENAEGFYLVLTDQPGRASWPITGASFILLKKNSPHPETTKEVLRFLDWCYRNGEAAAVELHYVTLPENVVSLVEKRWAEELRAAGTPLWDRPTT